MDDTRKTLHPFYEIGKLMARLPKVRHCDNTGRAIKTYSKPLKQNSGVRSRVWRPWNILPDTAFAAAFHAERKAHPKLEYRLD